MSEAETSPKMYTPDRCWMAYEAGLSTTTDAELAKKLKIEMPVLQRWKADVPEFYRAIQASRTAAAMSRSGMALASKEIVEDLPEDLKQLWDLLSGDSLSDEEKVKLNVATRGDFDRQRLMVHGLTVTGWDIEACCRILKISKATLNRWTQTDPRFARLAAELLFRKQNFVESALMRMVREGDGKATMFAAQALLKDRGYEKSLRVEGQVNHVHSAAMIDIAKLDLDLETKAKVIEAIAKSQMLDMDGIVADHGPKNLGVVEGEVLR